LTEEEHPRSEGAKGAPSVLYRLSDTVNLWCERLLFVLMTAMICFTTLQVLFRVFFTALSWTEEITCFFLFYASLVGTAVACKRGSHIAITFVVRGLPAPVRRILAGIVQIGGILFFGVMAYFGVLLMQTEVLQTSPGLQIPMTWIYAAFPIVGAVAILHLLAEIDRVFKGE